MMKKLLALLLTVALLCGAAFAQVPDCVGYWVATGAEVAGVRVDPSWLGLNAFMELYDDGSCVLVAMDQVLDGTWAVTENGITTTDANGDTVAYTYEEGELVTEVEGTKLFFTPGEYVLPLSGLTMEDFEGEWVFTYAEMGNAVYYPEELGAEMQLSLRDGKGVLTNTYMEETGPVTQSLPGICEIEEEADEAAWLFFLYTDEAGNPTGNGMALTMFEDEELVWYVEGENGLAICYCFDRAAE